MTYYIYIYVRKTTCRAATFWHVDPFFIQLDSWELHFVVRRSIPSAATCMARRTGPTAWAERAAGSDRGSPGILVLILRNHVEKKGSPDRTAFPGCWPDHVSPLFTRLWLFHQLFLSDSERCNSNSGSKTEIQTAGDSSKEEAIRVQSLVPTGH